MPWFEYLGYKLGQFPNAEYIGNNGLHVGIHQDMGEKELDYILNVVSDFCAKHKL